MTTPQIVSTFAGIGGLDLGVEAVLGAATAYHCEIEPGPCKVLTHRWPGVPNLGDVTVVDWSAVRASLAGAPVVLTGGFPCQDVSHAGRRRGLAPGSRSGLWSAMADAIDQLHPDLVVIENVRGLLSADGHGDVEPCPWCVGDAGDGEPALRALGGVLADLADLGYDAAWCGLRASDVGACHPRFRVFIAAWPRADGDSPDVVVQRGRPVRGQRPGDAGVPRSASGSAVADPDVTAGGERGVAAPGQAETGRARPDAGRRSGTLAANATGSGRDWRTPDPVRCAVERVATAGGGGGVDRRDVAADAPGNGRDEGRPESAGLVGGPDAALGRYLPTPTARDHKGHNQRRDDSSLTGALLPTPMTSYSQRSVDAWKAGRPAGNGATREKVSDLGIVAEQQLRPTDPERWGPYAAAVARWETVIGRPAPSPTEATGKGAQRLSPRFVEWMMGLPEGWVTDPAIGLSRNEQLKALGNGVVPQQAAAALQWLLRYVPDHVLSRLAQESTP